MRIFAIGPNYYNLNLDKNKPKTGDLKNMDSEMATYINDLSGMPYVMPITFTGFAHSSKLRALFAYKLPCMYTGIPMLDPKMITRLSSKGILYGPSKDILQVFERNKECFVDNESKIIALLQERSKIHPEMNLKELLEEIEPYHRKILRKKQAPIFMELTNIVNKKLPLEYQQKFQSLMVETDKKLNDQPIYIPFSANEFKYKLAKARNILANGADIKTRKALNAIMKESKKLSTVTNDFTIPNQQKVLASIEHILQKSPLAEDGELNNLLEISKLRLSQKKVVIPFSRKSFLYDLGKMLETLPDHHLKKELIGIANKLPTSEQCLSAYVLKLCSEPSDKIALKLMWPSVASVEHIKPRSEGGENELANYGVARAKINSSRKSIPLDEWVVLHPEVKQNCQKYLDKLIDLYQAGIFQKHNISPDYMMDFADTVKEQSKGKIQLDISRLFEY